MSEIPTDLKYSKTHEWVRPMDDGTLLVGITDHAQEQLGDMVFVEVPETGSEVKQGDECAVVESVKAASDIYSPVSGEITEANDSLADSPELLNKDPYGEGWLFRLRPTDEGEVEDLMDADAYKTFADSEGH